MGRALGTPSSASCCHRTCGGSTADSCGLAWLTPSGDPTPPSLHKVSAVAEQINSSLSRGPQPVDGTQGRSCRHPVPGVSQLEGRVSGSFHLLSLKPLTRPHR